MGVLGHPKVCTCNAHILRQMHPCRRFFEETAWRIKAVKLERDRHAQQRHLNPLNVGDLFSALVDSLKGRHRDAILVLGEVRCQPVLAGMARTDPAQAAAPVLAPVAAAAPRCHYDPAHGLHT